MVKATFTAIVGAAALALMAVGASAAPLSQANKAVDASAASIVEKVHGCHQHVDRDYNGWHYHRGYNCRRIWAESPRRNHYESPRRYYDHRRAPVCKRVCKYVGPIKVCEDKCW